MIRFVRFIISVIRQPRHHKTMARQWLYACHQVAWQKKIIDALLISNKRGDNVEARTNLFAVFLATMMQAVQDRKLRQAIMNQVVFEIDDAYRLQGTHDMTVGKRVKPLVAKLYARLNRYHAALQSKDKDKLLKLLVFYFGEKQKKHYPRLVDYLFACQQHWQANWKKQDKGTVMEKMPPIK